MRLRHVEVFHAIKRSGSISRAAELLCISQPAVSQALKHAELQLGFKLFRLDRGRLQPTPEAEMLAGAVEKVFQHLDAVQQVAANLRRGATGRLRVGCLPALGLNLLPLAVASYRKRFPGTTIEIGTRHSADLHRSLLMHEFDLAVGFEIEEREGAPAGLYAVTLGYCDLVYIDRESSRSADRHRRPIRLKDIELDRFLAVSTEPSSTAVATALGQQGMTFAPVVQIQTSYVAKALVEVGGGCAIVDEFTARADGGKHIVVRKLAPPIRLRVNVYRSAFHPAAESVNHLTAHLEHAFRSLSPQSTG
ncbi:MAG TPA: LysR substrate-binding domain-containing protein [Casimicrobiaceae bacterium]|nr:LysR substrate-binding domain-containing protein [Casimicrobiaceae bacterium]